MRRPATGRLESIAAAMSTEKTKDPGFAPPSRAQRARGQRTAMVTQLVATGALIAALAAAVTAVSVGIAAAAPAAAAHGSAPIAVATFLSVMVAGVGGLAAMASYERSRDRRRG